MNARLLGFRAHERIRALNIQRATHRPQPKPQGLLLAALSLLGWIGAGVIALAVYDAFAPFLRAWLIGG